MQYLFFCFWLTSLCVVGSTFNHHIRTDSNVFFFMANLYSTVYMYHNFFMHSSVGGHLDCFHVLAIVNSAAMNIGAHVSFSIYIFLNYSFIWVYPQDLDCWIIQQLYFSWSTFLTHRIGRNEEKMSPDVKEFTVKWKRQIFEERMWGENLLLSILISTENFLTSLSKEYS